MRLALCEAHGRPAGRMHAATPLAARPPAALAPPMAPPMAARLAAPTGGRGCGGGGEGGGVGQGEVDSGVGQDGHVAQLEPRVQAEQRRARTRAQVDGLARARAWARARGRWTGQGGSEG